MLFLIIFPILHINNKFRDIKKQVNTGEVMYTVMVQAENQKEI